MADSPRNMYNAELQKVIDNPAAYTPQERASFFGNTFGNYISPQEYLGALTNIYGPGDTWDSKYGGTSATRGGTSAPRSGGGGTPAPVLNQAAVDATNAAINSLGLEQDTGYRNIDDSFNSLLSQYDKEAGRNEQDYGDQTVTNNTNLSKNKQNALLAASQGLRGLRGTLASIGALGGTGMKLANRAVTTEANQDIGGAVDTYAGNAQNLDKAIGRFRDEDKDRRAEAETSKVNQRTKLEGDIASKKQQFYQKMAEIFAAADQTGPAGDWLHKAGDLNNEIASKTRVAATAFSPRAAAFTPGSLESYLAGAGDMTVDVADGGAGPGGLQTAAQVLAGRRRKREDDLVAA